MNLPKRRPYDRRPWLVIAGLFTAAILAATLSSGTFAMLGGIFRTTSTTDIDLQKGLIGWWKLDGNFKDSSPYGNNGTAVGVPTATTDRKGKAGAAYAFSGSGQAIDTGVTKTVSTFSFSMWAYANNFGPGTREVLSNSRDCCGAYNGFDVAWATAYGGLSFTVWRGGGYAGTSGGTTPLNTWTHLAGTYDGSTIRVYQNGMQVASTAASGAIGVPSSSLKIGQVGLGGGYFNGQLDDVRYYSRALSAAEMLALYKSYDVTTRAAFGENGLKAWWKMDGDAKDSSPYGNDGTVTGATLVADRKGTASSAYSFASGNTFTAPHSANINGNKAITIGAWIKPSTFTGFSSGSANIVQKRTGIQDQPFSLMLTGNKIESSWKVTVGGDVNGYVIVNSNSGVLTANTWAYVAVTRDATSAKIYINGVQSGATSTAGYVSNPPVTNSLPLNIGGATSQFSGFPGPIDDLRFYDRALSASEILAQYKSYGSQITVGNLQKGLVGYWPMNGTPKDATPFSNNASEQGGAALSTDRKGRTSSAYSLNGTSAYLQLNNGSNYSFPDTTFSLSFWEKAANASQTGNFVMANGAVSGGWGVQGGGGMMLKSLTNNQAAFTPLSGETATLLDTKWHHVVYVVTTSTTTPASQNIQMYIDGTPSGGSFASNGQVYGPHADLAFGRRVVGNNWAGSLDEVRIYKRGLTATEVSTLYAEYR